MKFLRLIFFFFFVFYVTCSIVVEKKRGGSGKKRARNRSSGVTDKIARRWNNFYFFSSLQSGKKMYTVNLINKKISIQVHCWFSVFFFVSPSNILARLSWEANSIGMKMFFQFKYLNFINSHNDVAEFKA